MRYVVSFSDRSSRRVDEHTAKVFMQAMAAKQPVTYKGCMYAHYSILSVKPIHSYYQDRRDQIEDDGKFLCKYGRVHESRDDCGCKDAGFELALTDDEKLLLKASEQKERAKLLSAKDISDFKTIAQITSPSSHG